MKFQKIVFALVIAIFVFIGCKNDTKKETPNQPKEEIVKADAKQVAINISGMTCEIGCAKLIQSKLTKQDGVLDAKVVFKDSIANIKYDASKTNKATLISFVNGIADHMYEASEVTNNKKECESSCEKKCCSDKEEKACAADCKKACCTEKKACTADCTKVCCTIVAV